MNHANGTADSCVQYYDFKAPKIDRVAASLFT